MMTESAEISRSLTKDARRQNLGLHFRNTKHELIYFIFSIDTFACSWILRMVIPSTSIRRFALSSYTASRPL